MLNPEFWQLYFSLQSADSEIPASPNDNTSAHYVLHDGLHSRSAISEHWAEGPFQTQIDNALVNQADYPTAGNQHNAPKTLLTQPSPVFSSTPEIPWTYTAIRDTPIAPSPIETNSPLLMHGPAAGQVPATSTPTTRRHKRSTRLRCGLEPCRYETKRPVDLERHLNSIKHKGEKHSCPSCTTSFTRIYNLKKHMKKH
ncbi:hypothetical protein AX14_011494 [Amanita brunnescens Koide BX004]|nr:hypothetical protein AX14_011494 [Amanita brunnescens Koide BX004]